jgi:hypothetical protein
MPCLEDDHIRITEGCIVNEEYIPVSGREVDDNRVASYETTEN